MTRWLVRFGYDGEGYLGWARQPGQVTVEGRLRDALRKSSLARTLASPRLEVASRTDAGVSARANALVIESTLPAAALLRGLNGLATNVFFTGARPIPPSFRVRDALWREYRYYLPGDRARADRLARIARALPKEVDARSFGRGVSSDRPVFRTIDRLTVRVDRRGIRVDVRARSFVWGMVRKIVAGLLAVESGHRSMEWLVEGAQGKRRLALPLAPADALLLWEVRYGGRWSVRSPGPTRGQEQYRKEATRRAETRARLVPLLSAGGPTRAHRLP